MTTFTAARARSTRPVVDNPGKEIVQYGTIEVSAHPVTADVYEMVRVPKGAVILGGTLYGESLVTAGTSTAYDIDVGWASNSSALGNLGTLSPAAVTGYKPEVGYIYPLGGLLLTAGPQSMDIDRTIILTVNTSAASANFNTSQLTLVVRYMMDGTR